MEKYGFLLLYYPITWPLNQYALADLKRGAVVFLLGCETEDAAIDA